MSDVLHQEFEVPCGVEEAWKHVIDPSWLGTEGVLEATPGTEGWVSDEEGTRYLYVEEVEEFTRLAYRWASFEDPPSRVEIELSPVRGGTRISVVETPLVMRARASLCAR